MYNYRYAAMILTGTMILGGLTGCASDDGSSGANNASTDPAKEQNTNTQTTNLENTIEFTESTFSEKEFMARVEAIEDGTLTLSLLSGEMGTAP
nr:hypothetical protein [Lachnospiraceae bacterium]